MIHPMIVDLLIICTTATCLSTEALVITSDIIRRVDRWYEDGHDERYQAYLEYRRRTRIKSYYKFEEFDDLESLDYKGVPNKKGRIQIGALIYDNRYEANQYYVLCNRCLEAHTAYHWFHTKLWKLYLDQIGELKAICGSCREDISLNQAESYADLADRNMKLPSLDRLENLRIND